MKKIELNYINNEVLWEVKSITVEFDKSSSIKVRDLLRMNEVQDWLGGGPVTELDNFVLTVTSNYNTEDISLDEPVMMLKKKLKFKKFYIRKLLKQELHPQDKKVS